MQRTKGLIALAILVLMAGMLSAQIKFPVTDDGTALTYGTVVSVDGTNPNQVVAANGTDRTQDVVGVVTAVQNVGGTDYYLVVTEGFLELSGATFTPGDRLTVNATGDIVTSTNDEDILIGYAISATRVQILIDDDQARFTYFDDTDAGLGADNVQEAIDSLNDMIDDITSEDITFEGVVTFDSTVIFGDDSVYFGGPAIFDSTVEFNGQVDADTINVGWLIGTENDTIYFEQYLAGPEVVIDSIEAFGDGPIVIKDSTEFREKVTFEDEVIVEGDINVQGAATFDSTVYIAEGLEVDGDATFHDNVTVDDSLFAGYIDVDQMVVNDTLFANIIDADSAFFNYTETGDLIVNDSAYFGGPTIIDFDLTVNDSAYFGGPVVFDSSVVFNQPIQFDTLRSADGDPADTIVVDAQLKVHGELIADSIQAVGDTIYLDDHIFVDGSADIVEDIEVGGDGYFDNNVYVTDSLFAGYIDVDQMVVNDTLFANIIDADSAIFNYTETGDLVVNDSAYFGGPVVFDSTVVFNGPFDADTINVGWLIGTENDTIYFEQYLAGPEVVIDSIEAFGDGPIVIKDSTEFREKVTFEDEVIIEGDINVQGAATFDSTVYIAEGLEVDGDATFHDNVYVDDSLFAGYIDVDQMVVNDTLFANIIDADSAFFNYTETGDLVVNDSAYFGGPVVFDSTVVFNGPFDADTINVGWLIGTENDTIYFEQYLAGPEVVIDSIEAFGEGPIVIKDSTEFREKVTFEDEVIVEGDINVQGAATFDSTVYIAEGLEVDGDATFHDNVTVDDSLFAGYIDVDQMVVNDTLFANIIDADSAFFNYTETGDLIVNDSAYFGGPSVFGDDVTIEGDLIVDGTSTFDSTVVFGDDSVTFGGPVTFDSTVVFNGDIVLDQNIVQATRSAVLEFDTTPTEAIALTFTTSGDVIELSATVVVSDEYSTTPNYNGAKITVELYDVTNTTVLKSYTVFLQDKDWYEIKEVSVSHVMSAPAADNDYSVRCFADGWGNGGRIIEGDLTVTAIQQ